MTYYGLSSGYPSVVYCCGLMIYLLYVGPFLEILRNGWCVSLTYFLVSVVFIRCWNITSESETSTFHKIMTKSSSMAYMGILCKLWFGISPLGRNKQNIIKLFIFLCICPYSFYHDWYRVIYKLKYHPVLIVNTLLLGFILLLNPCHEDIGEL